MNVSRNKSANYTVNLVPMTMTHAPLRPRLAKKANPAVKQSTASFDLGTARALYSEQLKDPRWKAMREVVLQRDGHTCRCCGSTSNLQVHHRQYHTRPNGRWIAPWEYVQHLLITFCEPCHKAGHKAYTVPTFTLPR